MGNNTKTRADSEPAGDTTRPAWSLAFEALATAVISTYIIASTGMITEHSIEPANPLSQNAVIASVNALAIILISVCNPKANRMTFLRCGFFGVVLCFALSIATILLPGDALQLTLVACRSATSGVLVVAWCEHLGAKPNREKSWILAVASLLFSCIVLVFFFVDVRFERGIAEGALLLVMLCGALIARKGCTAAPFDDPRSAPESGTSFAVKASFFLSSLIMMAFLFAFASVNESLTTLFSFSASASLAPLWLIVLATSSLASFLLFVKKPTLVFPVIAIPLLSLVLFFPFAFSTDPHRAILSVGALFQICFLIICSAKLRSTYRVVAFGPIRFVAWTRSLMLVGGVLGTFLGTWAIGLLDSMDTVDALMWAFLLCSIICVSVATLFGFQETATPVPAALDASFENACVSIARRYSLTKRETEVFLLLAQGRGVPFVRKALYISAGTADTHVKHIYQKLGIHSREELLDLVHIEPETES